MSGLTTTAIVSVSVSYMVVAAWSTTNSIVSVVSLVRLLPSLGVMRKVSELELDGMNVTVEEHDNSPKVEVDGNDLQRALSLRESGDTHGDSERISSAVVEDCISNGIQLWLHEREKCKLKRGDGCLVP